MNRKRIIIISILVAVLVIAAAAVILFVIPGTRITRGDFSTNDSYYYDNGAPQADPNIVGMWRNVDNPKWFKVYYDDYDGDGFFWGKEWDEADDVFEEDLYYHGNGWFRWRKEGKNLKELHTMEISEVPIPKIWRLKTKPDSLLLFYPDSKTACDRFGRVPEEW